MEVEGEEEEAEEAETVRVVVATPRGHAAEAVDSCVVNANMVMGYCVFWLVLFLGRCAGSLGVRCACAYNE